MDTAELIKRFPRLWHTALLDNRASIRTHGLLSSVAILQKIGAPANRIQELTRRRRPESVVVEGQHGTAVLRDQKPLQAHNLKLEGVTEDEWHELLNNRVFFWLSEGRLNRMLSAPPYRNDRHLVLQVDTATLVARHGPRIELSRINSGATIFPTAPPRGRGTFQPVEDYVHKEIAELTVLGGVHDIAEALVSVETRQHDQPTEPLRGL